MQFSVVAADGEKSMYEEEIRPTASFKLLIWAKGIDFSFAKFLLGCEDSSPSAVNISEICEIGSEGNQLRLHLYEVKDCQVNGCSFHQQNMIYCKLDNFIANY